MSDRYTPDDDDDDISFDELDLDAADAVFDRGAGIAELAAQQRAWRFGHVIVDEAQDLTPMQWRMVVRRARGNSMTIVGDLAQRSTGAPGEWREHLPSSITDFGYRELTTNYRSPAEVNELAASILAELAPKLTRSTAIRRTGVAPRSLRVPSIETALPDLVAEEQNNVGDGKVAVIAQTPLDPVAPAQLLTPRAAKGLEFDSVIVVEPSAIVAEPHGLSLLYVAVTRTTRRLTIMHTADLPPVLARSLS
ncbi:MAG: ATP-binding domain-containing protein [Acidimicrobiales bacterium]